MNLSPIALAALDALLQAGLAAFQNAADPDAVETARVEFLGQKQGRVKAAQERLKSLEPAQRREYGLKFNSTKAALEAACEAARSRLDRRRTTDDQGQSTSPYPASGPDSGTAIP